MNVLLIAPYVNLKFEDDKENDRREDFYPSAALLHLAAILRFNDHKPTILDFNNSNVHKKRKKYLENCKKNIIENLDKLKPKLVGINCLFSQVFPDVLEFARLVKSHSPNTKVAIGGIHPTTFPIEILTNCPEIDFVAIGEGENTIVALVSAIEKNNEESLSEIKSFAFRDKYGKVKINRLKNYIDDLDTLPLPAWDLIDLDEFEMKLDHYYNPNKLKIKHKAAIFSSRACPLACNFCDMFLVMGKKHRKRSIRTIVNEIELLHKEYGVNYFSFMDDQLTLNRGHVMELCDEILKRNIKIVFDTPNGLWLNSLREEVIAKMAEAGLANANLAIEHGNEYIRNKIVGKNLERSKILEVAGYLKKYKVMSSALFIMGFPEETNETCQDTLDLIEEIQPDKFATNMAIPFPGTALFKQVVKDNLFVRKWDLKNLWKYPMVMAQTEFVIKPYNMSLEDLHKWKDKYESMHSKFWKTNPIKRKPLSANKTSELAYNNLGLQN